MFAGDYKLDLSSPREGGTLVTVIVPFRPLEAASLIGDSRPERSGISAEVAHMVTSGSLIRRLADEETAS